MANGYGSSSGSSSSPRVSTTSATGIRQPAPVGFHYMPDGTLMSDTEHAELYGKKAGIKLIRKFNFDTKNISQNGEVRKFNIVSDKFAVFSLEILNEDSHYYNFETKTFAAEKYIIDNYVMVNGLYKGEVVFPAVTDSDHYDVRLWAPDIYKTKHTDYIEVRNEDDSINLNASSGSNSNLLAKKIFQYIDVNVTISVGTGIAANNWGTLTGGTQVISGSLLGTSRTKHSFSITATAPGDGGIAILRQPIATDVHALSTRQYGTAVEIPGENLYSNIRGKTKTTGAGEDVDIPIRASYTDLGLIVGDAVAVGEFTTESSPLLTIAATAVGGDPYVIRLNEAITFADNVDISFYRNGYYRWNIHADSSLHGLTSGMSIVGANGVTPSVNLGDYNEELTKVDVKIKYKERGAEGLSRIKEEFTKGLYYPAIEKSTITPTYTSGVISKQLGVITHAKQQAVASANQTFKVYAYGREQIASLTYCDAVFTNLKVELTELTTLVDGAVSASTTVTVDDRSGFINNVTRVRAVGIDGTSGYPLVTAGGGNDGGGNLTISSSQTIEDNQPLTLLGTGSVVTITGDVEFKRFPTADTSLLFDASKFLLTN